MGGHGRIGPLDPPVTIRPGVFVLRYERFLEVRAAVGGRVYTGDRRPVIG